MDEHEMEIAKKANKYLYGISDHEKIKMIKELIDDFEKSHPIEKVDEHGILTASGPYVSDADGGLSHRYVGKSLLIEEIKKILESQKKTKAFGFD